MTRRTGRVRRETASGSGGRDCKPPQQEPAENPLGAEAGTSPMVTNMALRVRPLARCMRFAPEGAGRIWVEPRVPSPHAGRGVFFKGGNN